MKRLFFILAIACMATIGMNAQRYNRASFGIIGGLTSSKSHVKDVDASSLSLYHVGITAQLPLFSGLAIQPSLLYQVKGTSVDNIDDAQWNDFQTKVGYLELPVQVQWGPDLGFLRPYAFAEPFVGYRLGSSNDGQAKTIKRWEPDWISGNCNSQSSISGISGISMAQATSQTRWATRFAMPSITGTTSTAWRFRWRYSSKPKIDVRRKETCDFLLIEQ